MAAIETTGLAKRYRRVTALSDCTISVPEGRISALVGPNGAGKTTLLRLLAAAVLAGAVAALVTVYCKLTGSTRLRVPTWVSARASSGRTASPSSGGTHSRGRHRGRRSANPRRGQSRRQLPRSPAAQRA